MGKAAYAVTVGTEPGVYDTWYVIEASFKIRGVHGAVYQGFASREEAERVFQAALARGEVMAASQSDATRNEAKPTKTTVKQEIILSPVSPGVSLLMTPDAKSTGILSRRRRRAMPSPPPSPVDQLHKLLKESSISSALSSPPTGVTQYGQLETEDCPWSPTGRASPTKNLDGGSSLFVHSHHIEESPFALMGNRRVDRIQGRRSPTKNLRTSTASSQESSEEEGPAMKRKLPKKRSAIPARGVTYRTLDELVSDKNIDPRIWLPGPPKFDPAKVKHLPATRPSSPVKPMFPSTASFETAPESSGTSFEPYSANIRMDRGRPSRLALSSSLPVLPSREVEVNLTFSTTSSSCPSVLNVDRSPRRKSKMPERSISDDLLAEGPLGYCHTASLRNIGSKSHIQVVQKEDGSRASAFRIHCPPGCLHELCSTRNSEIIEAAGPNYANAAVSPIVLVDAGIACDVATNDKERRPETNVQKVPLADTDGRDISMVFGFTQEPHVSHRGVLPYEADVRSPIAKGTQIPFSAAE
ncbi:hypothetical protein ID866_5751 [Astraeus odoratus]|nr:hypothetical protein ID866_5751 [Astraeus odoratus]